MNPNHQHQHQLHYGYAPTSLDVHWPSARQKRRSISTAAASESDCDDVFSEDSSSAKDQQQQQQHGGSGRGDETDSCQMLSRKKRRGVIEKKRRDRINTSLSELKRLVPSAFEKQGSAKLEKAEILQMTVDHLKKVHAASAKGFDALSYDPHKFAMDYHSMGFRECATEVARYLVTIEGMDLQDPLRLRLMSHLQCFAAQRELASKQTVPWSPYSSTDSHLAPPPPPPPPPPSTTHYHHHHHPQSLGQQELNNPFDVSSASSSLYPVPSSSALAVTSASVLTPLTPVATTAPPISLAYAPTQQFSNNAPDTSGYGNGANGAHMKQPYRPWGGAEVAY